MVHGKPNVRLDRQSHDEWVVFVREQGRGIHVGLACSFKDSHPPGQSGHVSNQKIACLYPLCRLLLPDAHGAHVPLRFGETAVGLRRKQRKVVGHRFALRGVC